MRISFLSASFAATLAAVVIGLTWHHEREQADAVRELTAEVAGLRAQLASPVVAPVAPVIAPPPELDAGVDVPPAAAMRAPLPRTATGTVTPAMPPLSPLPLPSPVASAVDGGRPLSSAQAAALASASDLVDAAIRRGTISRSEMAILRARIDAAGKSEESDALRAEIADAIDQGQVVAERPPPIWH